MDQDTADVTQTKPAARRAGPTSTTSSEAMRDVVDPELGINVVDLGLVYGMPVDDDERRHHRHDAHRRRPAR